MIAARFASPSNKNLQSSTGLNKRIILPALVGEQSSGSLSMDDLAWNDEKEPTSSYNELSSSFFFLLFLRISIARG